MTRRRRQRVQLLQRPRTGSDEKRKRMKALRWINYILILAFLSACAKGGPGIPPIFSNETPTSLPTAQVTVIPAPDAQAAVTEFLQALQKDDYETMYAMLAK